MLSADGRFVITFNGEIYNYRELRRRLESLGHEFRTDTDTEVLIEAFAQWGVDCLAHLNGMFAFAVWDERERTLTLARDRLGIKPLFYATTTCAGTNGESLEVSADGESLEAGATGESLKAGVNGGAFVFGSEAKAILASGLVPAELYPGDPHP